MKVIKINPEEKTITEINIEQGLKALQDQVGGYIGTYYDHNLKADVIYCDDYKEYEHFWESKDYSHPVGGICLLTSHNSEGDTTDYDGVPLEEVESLVIFS